MLQHADAVWAGARLPHNQVVQGGQHRRRLLRRKVTTLQKELLFLQNKSNLFMHRLDIYMFAMCRTQNLKSQDIGRLHQVFAAIWGGLCWGGGETFRRWRESEEDWALIERMTFGSINPLRLFFRKLNWHNSSVQWLCTLTRVPLFSHMCSKDTVWIYISCLSCYLT